MKYFLFFLTSIIIINLSAQNPVGIFQFNQDIGNPKNKGAASFDEKTQVYTITGSGSNIWFNRDEFHYLYNKISGDFIVTADFDFTEDIVKANAHCKIGWMVRESADEGAASWNAVKHFDGLCLLQWRPFKGMFMRDPEEERFFAKKGKGKQTMQLQRIGNVLTMKIANPGEPLQLVATEHMEMKKEVLAGIYICSHDSDAIARARVWNVRIDRQPVLNNYSSNPYAVKTVNSDVLGCRVEVLDIENLNRKVVYESKAKVEAASWMHDGNKLLFSEGTANYVVPVTGGSPEKIDAGDLEKMTNPSKVLEKKMIQPVITLTKTAIVDGTVNSPDGKFIYYNTNVTGTMQIWRMKPDGSVKEQLTFDEYHNWFPHISPDGNLMVFVSFPPDIDPDAHPTNKDVMLRVMKLNSPGTTKVVAYLYGGDGTLSANPWSPDSKKIAFISYSGK